MFQNLFRLGFPAALILPLIANPLNLEGHSSNSSLVFAQSLPTEWSSKPPEGCDPADPSTCRRDERQEGGNRDKPEKEPNSR